MERLDLVELFADAGELDGLAGERLDRERSAAARVAVELREHDAGDVQRLVERRRRGDRVLTDHCVDHEQDLRRLDRRLDVLQLGHERLVDVQAARRVEKHEVVAVLAGVLDAGLGDLDRVALPHLEHGDVELRADGFQLLDRRRAVHVARDEQRALALLFHQPRELRAVGGLARALQADEHHDARRFGADVQLLVFAAHEGAKLLVDDLDDHLRRGETFEHIRAGGAFSHLFYKVLDDLEVDVRLQQGEFDLAHGLLDVGLGEPALAAQALERLGKFIRQGFKCHNIYPFNACSSCRMSCTSRRASPSVAVSSRVSFASIAEMVSRCAP